MQYAYLLVNFHSFLQLSSALLFKSHNLIERCLQREDFASELVKHMKEALHGLDDNIVCPSCKIGKSLQAIETHYRECLKSKFRMKKARQRKGIVHYFFVLSHLLYESYLYQRIVQFKNENNLVKHQLHIYITFISNKRRIPLLNLWLGLPRDN